MQDTVFYTSMFALTAILAQMPEVQTFKEFSATVMLGILFWYTLTRINSGLAKLTESIQELNRLVESRIERDKED